MSAAQEEVVVPIKVEGVIVGLAMISSSHPMEIRLTAKGTDAYLREGVLMGLFESLSLEPNYYPPDVVPDLLSKRAHLTLTKEL